MFGKIVYFLSLIASIVYSIILSFTNDYKVFSIFTGENNYEKFYIKPWVRAQTFILGILLGLLYREYDNEKRKIINSKENIAKKMENNSFLGKVERLTNKKSYYKFIYYIFGTLIISGIVWLPRDL